MPPVLVEYHAESLQPAQVLAYMLCSSITGVLGQGTQYTHMRSSNGVGSAGELPLSCLVTTSTLPLLCCCEGDEEEPAQDADAANEVC